MRKSFIAAAALVASVATTQAHAADWTYVTSTANGMDLFVTDIKPQSRTTVQFWWQTVHAGEQTKILWETNCETSYHRPLHIVKYYPDGSNDSSSHISARSAPIVPGSVGEIIQNHVCSTLVASR